MLKEKKVFAQSGMNLDTDVRSLPPNHYGYALNILSNNSNGSNLGCIENRKGNTLISFTLPDGVNRVCGAVKDIQRSAIVYFVQNSLKNHCILRYNIKTKTIDKIAYAEPILNFQPDIIISSINIVGDLLYWTDGYFNKFTYEPSLGEFKDQYFNPPRKLNMVKAYNYTNNVAVNPLYKYSAITEEILDRIKYPPKNKPIVSYNTDDTKKTNLLIGSLYQFAYRYVYDDNERSVVSPYSLIPQPTNSETWVCKWDKEYEKNNVIELWVDTGSEIVKQIELFVRLGNTVDWYKFDTIDKFSDDGSIVIGSDILYEYIITNGKGFYNDVQLLLVDLKDMARLFDYVGQTVDAQTLISENRLVDGSFVEDYDNIDIDITLTRKEESLYFLNTPGLPNPIYDIYTRTNLDILQIYGVFLSWQFGGFQPNCTYEIIFTIHLTNGNDDILSATYTTGAPNTFSIATVTNSWVAQINAQAAAMYNPQRFGLYNDIPSQGEITFGASGYYGYAYNYDVVIREQQVATSTASPDIHPIISAFKSGHKHFFGIVYYDRAGRSGGVNISDNSSIYIPVDVEYLPHNGVYPAGYFIYDRKIYNNIAWEIKHKPPEWATRYQFVRLKNTPKFIQYFFVSAKLNTDGNIELDINDNITEFNDKVPKSVLKTYTYTKGDRIRFLYYGYFSTMYYNTFADYIDVEISGIDVTSGKVIIEDIGIYQYQLNCDPPTNPSRIADYICVEIYTPNKMTDSGTYVEFGEEYGISSPHTQNRAHMGQIQNQTASLSAKGVFTVGDIYVKNRYAVTPTFLPVEVENYSDIYISDVISIGRPNTVVPDMKRKKITRLRYSGQFLEDTRINNLSRFDWLNQEEIGNEHGNISSIHQLGDTLKVLQQNKNTSFYIGVQMMTSADGNQIPIQSTGVVLSKPNISPLGYGCQNPESVMVNDRYMYFYDQNYGVFIRDAANGMAIVSDNGMKSFFTRKRQEINDSYKHKVITSFNKKFNEVVVTFITYPLVPIPQDMTTFRDEVLIETVCFCENSDTWTTFLSYSKTINKNETPIDYMAYNGETFVTFLNGQLYLENDGVFGNFFGEQKSMVVDVISNIENEKVKIFSAIGLTTNHNKTSLSDSWYVDSIIVPTTDVNAAGQLSEIAASGFRMKEEALYADIPRDINSPMQGSNKFKLINGRVMRGQCATFRLKNNSNDAVVLYSVIIKTIPSEMSK